MRRQTGDKRRLLEGDGWSVKDVMLYVALVILILVILSTISPVNLLRSRTAANQASAVSSLRTINTAEVTYSSRYNSGYSPSLSALGEGGAGSQPTPSAAGLIDSVLASGVKSGYRITYVSGLPDKTGHIKTYTVVARPVEYGKSGKMSFFTDESGVICQTEEDRPATAKDPPLGG